MRTRLIGILSILSLLLVAPAARADVAVGPTSSSSGGGGEGGGDDGEEDEGGCSMGAAGQRGPTLIGGALALVALAPLLRRRARRPADPR